MADAINLKDKDGIKEEVHMHSWKIISRLQGIDWCTACGALRTIENDIGEVIHLPQG